MQYSLKIVMWRMLIGYGLSGVFLILSHFFAPEILDAVRPHAEVFALGVGAVVLGVDYDAFRRANLQDIDAAQTVQQVAEKFKGKAPAIALGLALLSAPMVASAQEMPNYEPKIRYTLAYDFTSRQALPVIGIEAASLRNVAGVRGLDAAVWFPLIGYSDRRTNLGAALVAPLRLADNATLQLGIYGRVTGGEKPQTGLILGITIR